jgi:hypothetical protein
MRMRRTKAMLSYFTRLTPNYFRNSKKISWFLYRFAGLFILKQEITTRLKKGKIIKYNTSCGSVFFPRDQRLLRGDPSFLWEQMGCYPCYKCWGSMFESVWLKHPTV